jgi:hypothetical protein
MGRRDCDGPKKTFSGFLSMCWVHAPTSAWSEACATAGASSCHGVPLLTVRLKKAKQPDAAKASVILSYRKGARKITTRLPVIELAVESSDIFSQATEFEILLEAQDKKGDVVGEPKVGGAVNAATGTTTLRPGQREQITLRMLMNFEGKFTVKALNPTTLTTYTTLDLETDYAV